jgi:VWFA-related protein
MKRNFLIAALTVQLSQGPAALIGFAQQPAPNEQQTKPSAQPQQPTRPSDDDVVKITTNLVQVDAVVTDKNGKLVTDLSPEEVQIFEDGRQQKVTHFSFVASESPVNSQPATPAVPVDKNAPPAPPVKLNPADVRRTIALVVDDLGLSFESTYYVRRALKKFVDQQMQPGDLVAIIRTGGGIGALQQFTADRRQLYAAIERVKWSAISRGGMAFAPIEDNSGKSEEAQAANEDLNQFREDVFAIGTLGAVNYVVRGMRELPGRKSILLISDGFRINSRDDPGRNFRALSALRHLIDQANRATVVIYTMNAKGLETVGFTAADSVGGMTSEQLERQLNDRRTAAFESQEGLDYLARETGGLAIRNTNDLSGGIRRVIEDQKGYYLIGYRPDESTFDKATGRRTFHKLSLKVSRPGKFKVRMRNGFYGVSDDAQSTVTATPRQQILNALTSPFGASGVRLRLTTLFANDQKVGSYMRSLLHVNANDLTFNELPGGSHRAEFDVVAITFGDNGNVVDQVARSYAMQIGPEDYSRIRRDGFVYFLTVPIKKAGAYQLRAALRDHGSEHVGSASQFIEVPDVKKNRVVVSGIIVTAVDSAPIKQSGQADSAAQQSQTNQSTGQNEGANLTISAATRQFKPGQILQYSFAIYNPRLDKANGQPQLSTQIRMFREGQPIFTGKETVLNLKGQADLKRIAIGGALQLGRDMVPGECVLQIVVTDPLADEKHRVATQWIDFEIIK